MPRARSHPASAWLIAIVMLTSALAVAPIPFADAQDATEPSYPDREAKQGPQDLILEGQLTDADTNQPVPEATLEIHNEWIQDTDSETKRGYDSFTTQTDAQGHYSLNVSQGRLDITIQAPGYDRTHASLEIEGNTTLNLQLRPNQADLITVDVTVTNKQNTPIPDAHVSLSPDYRTHCEGDVCYADGRTGTAAPEDAATTTQTQTEDGEPVQLRYYPDDDRYASGETDENGQLQLQVQPGDYRLRAWHPDHVEAEQQLSGDAGETLTATLRMTAIPDDTVTLTGTVRDADTGDPIPNAYVTVQNEKWGDWDNTRTDENGEYTLQVKPGYLLIEARADKTYWIPCEEPEPEPLPAEPQNDTASSQGGTADTADAMIAPRDPCDGQRERDHAYLSRVGIRQPGADEQISFDASLERAPEPDASFSGWVVNASSQQGVSEAWVSFYNEVANEWGQAQVDEDGSFRIDVRAGYYTIRVHAPGHFSYATNTVIESGDNQRLTLEVEPGNPRYGGCCYALEGGPARDAATAEGGDGSQAATDADGSAARQGAQVYNGSGGGLGPYQAGSQDASTTPWPVVASILAALGAGALTRHRTRN